MRPFCPLQDALQMAVTATFIVVALVIGTFFRMVNISGSGVTVLEIANGSDPFARFPRLLNGGRVEEIERLARTPVEVCRPPGSAEIESQLYTTGLTYRQRFSPRSSSPRAKRYQ
jgi:hypothetical protein